MTTTYIPTVLEKDLKKLLEDLINSSNISDKKILINKVSEANDVIDLCLIMGNELFESLSKIVQSSLADDPTPFYNSVLDVPNLLKQLLPFSRILVLTKCKVGKTTPFDLERFRTKYSKEIDAAELARDCRNLLTAKYITPYFLFGSFSYTDDNSFMHELSKIIPNSFGRPSKKFFTVDDVALLAASFLPEDYDITIKIMELANPTYQPIESLRSSKALDELRKAFKKEPEYKRSKYHEELWRSLNDKLDDIRYSLQKEYKIDDVKYDELLRQFTDSVNGLKQEFQNIDPNLFGALIDEIALLLDTKNIRNRSTTSEFYNYTKTFREKVGGFLRNYLQLCVAPNKSKALTYIEETKSVPQEADLFINFINKTHSLDQYIFSCEYPSHELFSNFEKLIDSQYHHLTKSEIAFNYLLIATWFACSFIPPILALVVLTLPHIALATLIIATLFVAIMFLMSASSKSDLLDNPFSELSNNEKSYSRGIFKTNYYDKIDTFFSGKERNNSTTVSSHDETIPYTAVSHETI